jgi:hypothetical protein
MEINPMRDLFLQCSGIAAIAVALIHGVLGETKVFARATIEPPRLRHLIRLVWQAGTVAWIGGGTALDYRDVRVRVCVCSAGQRLGDARPAFWVAGAQCGGRAGGCWLLVCGSPVFVLLMRLFLFMALLRTSLV